MKKTAFITVWPWGNAPEPYRQISPHGGDEDWVALVPRSIDAQYAEYGGIPWMQSGTTFGCCDVSRHEIMDGILYIGAHA